VTTIGSVNELRRYPVKSLTGELLTSADVDRRGLAGDRLWAVTDVDGKLGSGKSSRRFRRMDGLLQLTASYDRDLTPIIGFPDGRHISGSDPGIHAALSDHVGRPVRLRSEDGVSHFDDGPLHLVTTASLAALAEHHGGPVSTARLRSNLLVDVGTVGGFVENGWIGRTFAIGAELVISIRDLMPRCVMVGLPQKDVPPATGLLETIGRSNDGCIGVVADVVHPGRVHLDDTVQLLAGRGSEVDPPDPG
jgi:uncharacterized protein